MRSEAGKKIFFDITYDVSINTLAKLEDHVCSSKMSRNFDRELYRLIAHENERKFDSSVPFHPPSYSDVTEKVIEICNTSETGKQAFEKFHKVQLEVLQNPTFKPCTSMGIFMGNPVIDSLTRLKNDSYTKVYFQSHVKVKSMIMYYDFTALVADIGGYIGMFLGVSLMDLTMKFNNALYKHVTIKMKQ